MMKTSPLLWLACLHQTIIRSAYLHVSFSFCGKFLVAVALLLSAPTFTVGQTLSVSMSYPQFNSSYLSGTDITVQTTATTPTGTTITKIEFFYDAAFSGTYTKIGEDLTAPYSVTWTAPAVTAARSYQLRAVVTNSASNTAIQSGTGYTGITVYPTNHVSTRNWYVSAVASSTNTAGTEALPFNTIQKAADRVAPGDTVFVMGGTYTGTGLAVASVQRTGTPAHSIVFMPYKTDKPVIQLGNNNFHGFNILPAAAYIKIQGFEVIGNNANITLEQARQQPGACEGSSPAAIPTARFNGNGISVSGRGGGNARPHHVVIANNNVHDCAGAGISAIESDYITIEDNIMARTSWYTVYGTSGISIFNSWNYDNSTAIKMIVRRNRSYDNILKIAWNIGGTGTNCKFYDGNGIILDNNKAVDPSRPTVVKNALGDYTGAFLIENNLCYRNGGRGININYSDNAIIVNNTTYQNGASDGGPGVGIESEFIAQGASNINVYNNIFYGRPGEKTTEVSSSTITHNNNLTFEGTGTPYFSGNQNSTGQDPQFVDAANGDFKLSATSPAISAGSATPGQYALKDILGVDRPQGAGVDIGAYEYQGSPITIAQQPASSSAVCVGTSVSVSVSIDGSVKSYQWYKNGPSGVPAALTGIASATTATLTLPSTTTADQGEYFVVITGFNSLTSTAFSLTINTIPDAPNVNSASATQGTGDLTLTVTNCSGVVNWNGVDGGTSVAVSTTAVGELVYAVTCKIGVCTSPITSVTITVKARPATLSVFYKDGDNNQPTNNTVQPYLKLNNEGNTAIPYGEITLRYWLTVEDFAPVTNLSVYWAQLGTSKVSMKYVALSQPRQGALGYIEYSFDASAGSLAANSNSGEIQTGVGKQNWSNFVELDDYSFTPNAAYTKTDRITVYQNGVLVGGIEPLSFPSVTALKVYSENKNTNPNTNQISTYLKLVNVGNLPVDYSQLMVRYWFSSEGNNPLVYTVDYAELGNSNIQSKFVKENRAGTDTYLEESFAPTLGQLNALSSTGIIQQRINKSDWSTFNEANDYSYKTAGALAENTKITVYLNGSLIYGQEPAPPGARAGIEPSGLRVAILSNPVQGGVVRLNVMGAEGEPLQVEVIDSRGISWAKERIGQAGPSEPFNLSVGRMMSGVLLLRVSTPTQSQMFRLVKP